MVKITGDDGTPDHDGASWIADRVAVNPVAIGYWLRSNGFRTERILAPYDRTQSPACASWMRMPEGADWRDVAEIMLRINPSHERVRAGRAYERHLIRAKCVSRHGFPRLALKPFGTLFA
ncbi:hypothetical protein [Bradyrhizobium sp. i1.15.2]|uniref:hypothetical protein n=1 Tax=Bradyrhizobium sp. i1.15.2 TaxID=3156362 RepID=UPI0033989855